MYTNMVTLQAMDAVFYEAQRQGRISFYATTTGEEAINIASAAALTDNDIIVPQVIWMQVSVYGVQSYCLFYTPVIKIHI